VVTEDAGVVDQHVDAAQVLGGIHQGLEIAAPADVARDEAGHAAGGGDRLFSGIPTLTRCVAHVADDHLGALARAPQ